AGGQRHPRLGDPGPEARFAMRDPDVALVARVLCGSNGYVPDALTPQPPPVPWARTLSNQLDLLREVSPEEIARQLGVARYPGRRMPPEIRQAMESGTFARRAANGLHGFWRGALAENWRALEEAMVADVRRRAWTIATAGVGQTLATLHRKLDWADDQLRIH